MIIFCTTAFFVQFWRWYFKGVTFKLEAPQRTPQDGSERPFQKVIKGFEGIGSRYKYIQLFLKKKDLWKLTPVAGSIFRPLSQTHTIFLEILLYLLPGNGSLTLIRLTSHSSVREYSGCFQNFETGETRRAMILARVFWYSSQILSFSLSSYTLIQAHCLAMHRWADAAQHYGVAEIIWSTVEVDFWKISLQMTALQTN
jgi:hypothetical protein